MLADLIDLRADHAATIAALEEAVSIGRELDAWGDLAYVEAGWPSTGPGPVSSPAPGPSLTMSAASPGRGRGQIDIDRWVTFMRTELAWRDGDLAAVVRYCWRFSPRSTPTRRSGGSRSGRRIRARLAMAVLAQGDEGRCRELLDSALDAAARWTEHPPLAAVLDACSCYLLRPAGHAHAGPARPAGPPTAGHGPDPAFRPTGPSSPPGCSARRTPSAAPLTNRAWTPRTPAPPPAPRSARPPSTLPTGPPPA